MTAAGYGVGDAVDEGGEAPCYAHLFDADDDGAAAAADESVSPRPPGAGLGTVAPMSEHIHGQAVLDEVTPLGRALRQAIPDVYQGIAALSTAAMAPGALDVRTKELIALGIAVTLRCDGCIAAHARAAVRAGASREEAAEAIGVALNLNGGPGTVYGPRAYDAFCEFAEAREAREARAAGSGTARS